MPLLFLLPDGESGIRIDPQANSLPLGAIITGHAAHLDLASDLHLLRALRASSPWAPAVLLVEGSPSQGLRSIIELGWGADIIWGESGSGESAASEVKRIVRERGVPPLGSIGGYLRRRHSAELALLVDRALVGDSTRTLRRRLHAIGPVTPIQWRMLELVLGALGLCWGGGQRGNAAHQLATTEITLMRSCRRLCHHGWGALARLGAWEAVVELVLRTHDYV